MKKIVSVLFFTLFVLPKFIFAETWTASSSPYLINNNVVVANGDILNIEAGTEVRMKNGTKFDIYGTLNILGTETGKISITSQEDDGSENQFPTQGGRWSGIVFNDGSKGNINYLDARYAGYFVGFPSGPMIYNLGGDVSVKNSKLYKTLNNAFYLKSGTTTIENTLIDQNSSGITFENSYLSLVNSTISNSTGQAFGAYNDGKIFLRNNIFSNNKYNSYINLKVDFDISSTTFIGGDFSAWNISGSSIGQKTISNIDGKPIATNGFIIESGNTLNVAPGTILKGGYLISRGGILNLNGTKENPIIFTSIADDTASGDTNNDGNATNGNSFRTGGIITETGGEANISNTYLKYAYGSENIGPWNPAIGSLINMGGILNVNNIQIEEGNYAGIHHYNGTTTIENSSIKNGGYNNGIVYDFGELNIHNSSFLATPGFYSLWNRENSSIPDVRGNFWGTTSGPYHETQNASGTAAMIKGNALFIPFLTELPGTAKIINPVIIIPGIMGSDYSPFLNKIVIDPVLHTYDNLIATFEANGYLEDKTLFTFPYEWRNSNVITANLLKDKINQVKQTCAKSNLPDINCNKVDLVAHSMGGLVAREYIQSGQYQNDVDQLIFLGTPHKGSPEVYLTWEAGEFPSGITEFLIKLKFTAEALRNFYPSLFDYIRNRPISSVQELLPVFDYIKDKDTGTTRTYPNNYPRNIFLETLNANAFRLFNSGINITNIIGVIDNSTIEKILVVPTNESDKWTHGKESGFEYGMGDKTVIKYGATLETLNNIEKNGKDHMEIITAAEGDIIKILTGKGSVKNIDYGIIHNMLIMQLHSPIDAVITAPDGKRTGKDFETGQIYNEIPLAFYSGYQTDNEFITIPNPIGGEYKIELQGVGEGGKYGVSTSYVSDKLLATKEMAGITEPNQITGLNVNFDAENPENISSKKIVTPDVLLSDISGAYNLGWIKDKKTKDALIKQVNNVIKFSKKIEKVKERLPDGSVREKRIDKFSVKINKILAKLFEKELEIFLKKGKINQEAYDLIIYDVEYLINNQ